MRMVWMFVSVAQASAWLERNRNRKLKPIHVSRLTADMKQGHFLPTHEAIAVYEDGFLADGQHRLQAIIASGCGQWVWVCYNVPLSSRDVIGGGVMRTTHDQTEIAGHGIPRPAIDIIKCVSDMSTPKISKPSTPQVVDFWERHEEALRFTLKQFATRVPRITVAAVSSVVFRAYYSADHERLAEFCAAIISGRCEPGADDGAVCLRNFVFRFKNPPREEVYSKTESALVAFLARSPMTKLYGFATEQFPLPEESDPFSDPPAEAAA